MFMLQQEIYGLLEYPIQIYPACAHVRAILLDIFDSVEVFMKHLISLSALAISLASAVSVAQARENEGRIDGTIRFAGEVVEAVCQLGNEAGILDIPLNPAPKSAVKKDKGQLFSRQNINLPWNGCPTHNNATLTFPGTADENGGLALDPVQDGQRGASGVAFGMLNKDNKPIPLNDPSEPLTLAGDATKDRLEFSVAYVANGDPQVKAGSASATLEFRVDYNNCDFNVTLNLARKMLRAVDLLPRNILFFLSLPFATQGNPSFCPKSCSAF